MLFTFWPWTSPLGIPTGALRGSLEQIEQDEGVPLGSEPRTEEGTMTWRGPIPSWSVISGRKLATL